MELNNKLFKVSFLHQVLILLTLVLSGPEAIAPQLQTEQISQKSVTEFLAEIERPTVEAPSRNTGKKPRYQLLFLPPATKLPSYLPTCDSPFEFSSISKNQFLVSASARGPPQS